MWKEVFGKEPDTSLCARDEGLDPGKMGQTCGSKAS